MAAKPTLKTRSSGVLLHPTSLPGARGGTLGAEARRFADFLGDAGQAWWQMLPVCPPDGAGSPYASPSAFAGGTHLIDADDLAERGLLKPAELGQPREKALRRAWDQLRRRAGREDKADFEAYLEREKSWLADHALFMALKGAQGGRPWVEWDAPLRTRRPEALAAAEKELAAETGFHAFGQWLFDAQWRALRVRAAERGVGLIGDAPIYVSHDSADCWASQESFRLDADGRPEAVAGVPPDYFSKTGQLWGNPLYRWERHLETGFAWWTRRLAACAARFDAVRLDHFIGFRNYWEIPAGAKTAVDGKWTRAPGDELFAAVARGVPGLEIIAEDLGVLTPEVEALRDSRGLPGMKVAQFCFDSEKDGPAHWPENCVAYTGTHDNDTARGWGRFPAWELIGIVWRSRARVALAPMQDLLDLPSSARMNTPGTASGNWGWRMAPGDLNAELAASLRRLTEEAGRR